MDIDASAVGDDRTTSRHLHCSVEGLGLEHRVARQPLIPLLASDDDRWIVADDIPEADLARAAHGSAVRVEVDVPLDQPDAFAAFVDADLYSHWLGVPVRLRDRRFSTTLEWGTQVRGTYEVVSPPDLIAMRWDFDDNSIPLPGRGLVAHLRVHPTTQGSRVEVHQLAEDAAQAEFLTAAWSMVLGRFAEAHSTGTIQSGSPRTPRPKRQRPD
jgi:uncharacterized protein YndB with AHSA1/START domain